MHVTFPVQNKEIEMIFTLRVVQSRSLPIIPSLSSSPASNLDIAISGFYFVALYTFRFPASRSRVLPLDPESHIRDSLFSRDLPAQTGDDYASCRDVVVTTLITFSPTRCTFISTHPEISA